MRRRIVMIACWIACGAAPWADAADVFITIGGGADPSSNQISLEKNIQFLQRTMDRVRDDAPRHEIYFADGRSDHRDLQYRADDAPSDSQMWMSILAGNQHAADLAYRNHQVEPVAGPSRKAFIKEAFTELSQTLGSGDRLILYVTAHGGPSMSALESEYGFYGEESSNQGNDHDTTIALWNNEELSMTELTDWLDAFDAEVEIVMVMVQCYSGGFAHSIFHDGDRRLGLNPRPRCGFFSQRHDRPSAGCTPEVLESEYQDYSTFFWAALGGVDRSGAPLDSADYDGDGRVSFAEAHAYALIVSETLDIPLKTSGALLRRYSKFGPPLEDPVEDSRPTLSDTVSALFGGQATDETAPTLVYDAAGLLTRQSTIEGTLELSTPDQRAVIERLTEVLEIPHETTIQEVRRRYRQAERKRERLEEKHGVKAVEYELQRSQLSNLVHQHYPELAVGGYVPKTSELTSTGADDFVQYIESQPQAEVMRVLTDQTETLAAKVSDQEVLEARLGRLLMTLDDILLEENLPQTAPEPIMDHYLRMLAMERGTLRAD